MGKTMFINGKTIWEILQSESLFKEPVEFRESKAKKSLSEIRF